MASLALGGAVAAQAVTTAAVTQTLLASASGTGVSQIPPGPLPVGGISMLSPAWSSCSSRITAVPVIWGMPSGATGWVVAGSTDLGSTWPWPASYSGQVSGRVRLHLQSPQPVAGLLYCEPQFLAVGLTTTGDASLDLDGNGVDDYFARTATPLEIPLTLDAVGIDVEVGLSLVGTLNASSSHNYGSVIVSWRVLFLPDGYGLETYQRGCVPLSWYRADSYAWVPILDVRPVTTTQLVAGFFLLGLGEQDVPLGPPPNCHLLVASPSVVAPTTSWSGGMGLTLPHVPIPRGIRFRCQAIFLDSRGWVMTSDAIRTK